MTEIIHPTDSHRNCLRTALRLLSRRDHGVVELRKKLEDRGFAKPEIDSTIKECVRLDYLNDDKFSALSVIRYKNKGYGTQRINQKLSTIGIEKNIIARALAEHYSYEQQISVCRQVLKKKLTPSIFRADRRNAKARLYRFLHARGFLADIINLVISSELDE